MAALINNNSYNNILPYDTKKRWLIIFTNEKNNLKKRYFRFTRMQKRYFIIDPTNVEIIYFVNHHSSLPSDRIPLNNIKDIRMIKKDVYLILHHYLYSMHQITPIILNVILLH